LKERTSQKYVNHILCEYTRVQFSERGAPSVKKITLIELLFQEPFSSLVCLILPEPWKYFFINRDKKGGCHAVDTMRIAKARLIQFGQNFFQDFHFLGV
jgi:hypothetical protein